MNWHDYFISMTVLVAQKSKDPSRQVGCVIVGPDNEIRSTGFNGFPRGVQEMGESPGHYVRDVQYNLATRDMAARCSCGDIIGRIKPPTDLQMEGSHKTMAQFQHEAAELHEHFRPGGEVVLMERWERPQKYDWVEHAERNAIYNAARMGIPLKGCSAYITLAPCAACSRALIQSGIAEVYGPAFPDGEEYKDYGFEKSKIMLHEGGIKYVVIEYATENTA